MQSLIDELEEEFGALPKTKIVCPACNGEGHHLPESLGGDVTEMCAEDEEFEERYMAGGYDITCETCRGKNVVDSVDWGRVTHEIIVRRDEIEYARWEVRREMEMERRLGC